MDTTSKYGNAVGALSLSACKKTSPVEVHGVMQDHAIRLDQHLVAIDGQIIEPGTIVSFSNPYFSEAHCCNVLTVTRWLSHERWDVRA